MTKLRFLAGLLILTALGGCQTSDSPSPTPSLTPSPSPSPTTPPGIEVVVTGLDTPWALAFSPDGRMFISERPGRIRIFRNGLDPEPWMILEVSETGEGGLLGLALDPDFASNGFVYAAYTYRPAGGGLQNRLVRLREDSATGKGSLDKVLLDGVPGSANHDGGRVKFGPDGKLYWTIGDAQAPDRAQDIPALSGKILRLNPDGTIPADNPFPGSPVYSYGHRNPEGLAWEPGTGRLYATEHGASARDEINLIEAGRNYGWPVITGDETRPDMVAPVIHSGQDTWAPAGASFVERGIWTGSLVFAGLRGQSLYRLSFDKADPRRVTLFERYFSGEYGRLRDVVSGPDGALYITTSNRDGRGSPVAEDDRVLRLLP